MLSEEKINEIFDLDPNMGPGDWKGYKRTALVMATRAIEAAVLEAQSGQKPVAVCDTEGRLRFGSEGETRYGNCPNWIEVGTKLYSAPVVQPTEKHIDGVLQLSPEASCLCCGQIGVPKAWAINRPTIYVCETCHRRATVCPPDDYRTEAEADAFTHGYFQSLEDNPVAQAKQEPVAELAEDESAVGGAKFKLLKPLKVGTNLNAAPVVQPAELAAEYTRGRNDGWEAAEAKHKAGVQPCHCNGEGCYNCDAWDKQSMIAAAEGKK